MSSLFDQKWPWIEGTHQMRIGLLDTLSDADLLYNPGGDNMTLGALFRESGEVEHSYLQSVKTFKQDLSYRNNEADLDKRVTKLRAWYQTLDDDLKATLAALIDEDAKKEVRRDSGYMIPLDSQIDIYLQAQLIFLGKATIFFKSMGKTLPPAAA